jgi:hypothetical protein
MSQQTPSGAPGRGIMRRLAAGAGAGRFGAVFEFADALFSPSKTAARVEREQQRRRKVAVPAPGDPPADDPVDAVVALPTGLLGPVELSGPLEPSGPAGESGPAGSGGAAPADPPSARGEHGPTDLEQSL